MGSVGQAENAGSSLVPYFGTNVGQGWDRCSCPTPFLVSSYIMKKNFTLGQLFLKRGVYKKTKYFGNCVSFLMVMINFAVPRCIWLMVIQCAGVIVVGQVMLSQACPRDRD